VSSTVVRLFIVAKTCLTWCCLATTASSCSTILALSCHVTIHTCSKIPHFIIMISFFQISKKTRMEIYRSTFIAYLCVIYPIRLIYQFF
jgi:hypothetical protein